MNLVEEKIHRDIWNSREAVYFEQIEKLRFYFDNCFYDEDVMRLIEYGMRLAFYMRSPEIGVEEQNKLLEEYNSILNDLEGLWVAEAMIRGDLEL